MLKAMTEYKGGSSTACPSPEEWAEQFLKADNVIAITISHNLSGSYNAAQSAREMVLDEYPDKNIFILDTLSCAGALAEAAALANRLIGEGLNFEEVCRALTDHNDAGHILFALASFENLVKAGRVSRVVGFIAGALNMRVLGRRTPDGKIDFFYKTRGETRVLARILEQMDQDGFDCSHYGAHQPLRERAGRRPAGARHPRQVAPGGGGHHPLRRPVQLLRAGPGHYFDLLSVFRLPFVLSKKQKGRLRGPAFRAPRRRPLFVCPAGRFYAFSAIQAFSCRYSSCAS